MKLRSAASFPFEKDETSDDADEEVGEEDIYDSVEQHLPDLNEIV